MTRTFVRDLWQIVWRYWKQDKKFVVLPILIIIIFILLVVLVLRLAINAIEDFAWDWLSQQWSTMSEPITDTINNPLFSILLALSLLILTAFLFAWFVALIGRQYTTEAMREMSAIWESQKHNKRRYLHILLKEIDLRHAGPFEGGRTSQNLDVIITSLLVRPIRVRRIQGTLIAGARIIHIAFQFNAKDIKALSDTNLNTTVSFTDTELRKVEELHRGDTPPPVECTIDIETDDGENISSGTLTPGRVNKG